MLPLSGGGGRMRVSSTQKSRRSGPREPGPAGPLASAGGAGHGPAAPGWASTGLEPSGRARVNLGRSVLIIKLLFSWR